MSSSDNEVGEMNPSRSSSSLLRLNEQNSSETGSIDSVNTSESSQNSVQHYANISSSSTLNQMAEDSDGLSELNIQRSSEIERENNVSRSISGRNSEADSLNTSSSRTVNQTIDSDVSFELNSSESGSSASLSLNESNYSDDDGDHSDDDGEIQPDWINQPIFPGSTTRGGDALCQLLNVYVSNRLTKKALEDILHMVDSFLPHDHTMPRTKVFFYLEKWSDESQIKQCVNCSSADVKSYFLEFDLETELRNAFEIKDLQTLIDDYKDKCSNRNQDNVYDLMSGSEYQRLKTTAIPNPYDLLLIWFTDGVQVSKSGKSNMWPVYAQIANINPKFRRSFQFCCGIFYLNRSSKKPHMNSFLLPFSLKLQKLHVDGFSWFNKSLNCTTTSKVIAPVASLDAPAKSSVQVVMQYNGENSCGSCEETGESCTTGCGSNWVFPINQDNAPLRNAERMESQTRIVERHQLKHFKGVKGKSIVTDIPFFDRSKGFVADYMHAVLLGDMLMLLNLWCDSSNHEKEFYLKKEKRVEIDNILSSIAPPDEITRTPRKLSNLSDWKASELKSFLLYYGPVVLKKRLNEKFFNHFLLLARGIYLLSLEEITPTELNLAETLLHLFVIDVERLYGLEKCSYNVHQLRHLAAFVRMWGPLWVWSAFCSEDHNGELIRMIHGSNKIDVELSNTIKIVQAHKSIQFMMNPNRQRNHIECKAHGPSVRCDVTNSEWNAISRATNLTTEQLQAAHVKIYIRCIINDEIFTSILYSRQKKRTNFYVQWEDEETVFFGSVNFFVSVETRLYAVVRQLVVSNDKTCQINNSELGFNLDRHIIHIYHSYCIHAIPVQKLTKILKVKDYVCLFPNNMEKK